MAIIYQGDAELLIGATSIALNCNNVTIEVGYETGDATVMGDTGRKMVKTLESVTVTATVFLEYGASSVEALIYAEVGAGDTTLVILPSSGAAADNRSLATRRARLASLVPRMSPPSASRSTKPHCSSVLTRR